MPDDVWPLLSGAGPPASPSLDDLIAATQNLLMRYHTLSPTELHRLATNLAIIANRLDQMVDREERGESGDVRV